MNKNQSTNEKLQIEISEFINSFPCESPRSEPTQTTIDNYFIRGKKIDKNKLNHNINELYENGHIKYDAVSINRGYTISLTEKGKNRINKKTKFSRNWKWIITTILTIVTIIVSIVGLYLSYWK